MSKKRNARKWHPEFKKYMQFIVNHPNYSGMPFLYKENGEIRWVVTRSSKIGKARLEWWDKKRKELGIKKDGPWISEVAKSIHPTKEKPCQICGKVMKLDYIYPNKKGSLSPGAMSNAPDRLDGFHSYNLCCRSKHDTGRHKTNLARYGEDRRAYENWAEGDWKAASWLMKEFQKHGLSPDHLGPISLGFRHRPYFRPLSRSANSARNNRMTLADIKLLLDDEKRGENVISKHSKYIWDVLKNEVKTDDNALLVSKLMRKNLHYILSIFSVIAKARFKDFLTENFLHPKYAFFSIEFVGFNPTTGRYQKMIKHPGNKKQYQNNVKRYIRISFESLKSYENKKNRRVSRWNNKKIDFFLQKTLNFLSQHKERRALIPLRIIFRTLANDALSEFKAKS